MENNGNFTRDIARYIISRGVDLADVMRICRRDMDPSMIRMIDAEMREERVAMHHDHARHFALMRSDGHFGSYADEMARLTAFKTQEDVENEYKDVARAFAMVVRHSIGLSGPV